MLATTIGSYGPGMHQESSEWVEIAELLHQVVVHAAKRGGASTVQAGLQELGDLNNGSLCEVWMQSQDLNRGLVLFLVCCTH